MPNGNGKNGNGQLTPKQAAFVEAYLGKAHFNATEAARLAGYEGNDNTLGSVGWENLQKPAIAHRIKVRLQEAAMTADEVLARLAEIARGDIGGYITSNGELDIERLVADDKAHLIKKINRTLRHQKEDTTIERVQVEVYDSQRALETLAKHHGLLVERAEVDARISGKLGIEYIHDWRGAGAD